MLWLVFLLAMSFHSARADTRIDLDTTTIRGNKELPKILYIIPWKELKRSKTNSDQQLVLHSLFGDLFEPIVPDYSNQKENPKTQLGTKKDI